MEPVDCTTYLFLLVNRLDSEQENSHVFDILTRNWSYEIGTVFQWSLRHETDTKNTILVSYVTEWLKPGWRSRYGDWLRAGRPSGRSSSPGGGKNFYFISSRPALGPTNPPIQWVLGPLSAGVKRPGREADHWSRTNAEVKKTWVHTSTPPYGFMV